MKKEPGRAPTLFVRRAELVNRGRSPVLRRRKLFKLGNFFRDAHGFTSCQYSFCEPYEQGRRTKVRSANLLQLEGLAAVVAGVLLTIAELLSLAIGFSTPAPEAATSAVFTLQSVFYLSYRPFCCSWRA